MYTFPDGSISSNPTSQQQARQLRKAKYDDQVKCPKCRITSIKYTFNNRCIHCARVDALRFYNYVTHGTATPLTDDMIAALAAAGTESLTFKPTPCRKAGHLGVKSSDGKCWLCIQNRRARQAAQETRRQQRRANKPPSPRQIAQAAGEAWYQPTTPCPRCGTLAMRYVANGRCRGCRTQNEVNVMMENCPDLIIRRRDATRLGLTVYRNGKECTNGHRSYRYLSTGACVECFRTHKGEE